MKKTLISFFCLACSVCASLAQDITYVNENNGVLILSVTEPGVKKNNAVPLAVKDALFQVLFRGIPDSEKYSKALLGTDERQQTCRDYYESMIDESRIYSFIISKSIESYKKKTAVVYLSINMQAMIADLEKKHLYKRFGFK